jgi:hypothetical protein
MPKKRSLPPSWLLTTSLSPRTTGICERDGVWSVILNGPAVTSRPLDEALVTALRAPTPAENPRSG